MRVFVDLDGVLADFDHGYAKAFGRFPSKTEDDVDWDAVRRHEGFYRDLPPTLGMGQLRNRLAPFRPTVLTGVPYGVPEAESNKREWVDRWLGWPMIGCRSSEKYKHGRPGDLLIDDREKYKHRWEAMGGTWITHRSVPETLRRLEELGIC